jgi:gas vesicle protein
MTDNNNENLVMGCKESSRLLGQKFMFLMIGAGVGATLALLFAPKRGSELRGDIADMAVKGYDETLATARRLKEQSAEYYAVAKEAGSEVLDVVAAGATAVKQEVTRDVAEIGTIVDHSAKRAVNSARRAVAS